MASRLVATEQRQQQQLGKGRPSVDQGEIKGKMSDRQDHHGRQQLKDHPAQSFADDDRRATDGGGEEALQDQGLTEVIEEKGYPENSGTEQ